MHAPTHPREGTNGRPVICLPGSRVILVMLSVVMIVSVLPTILYTIKNW